MKFHNLLAEASAKLLLAVLLLIVGALFVPKLLISAGVDVFYTPKAYRRPPQRLRSEVSPKKKRRHKKVRASVWM